jgi:6-phosphogluconolactonase
MSDSADRYPVLRHLPGRVVVVADTDALIDQVAGELTVRAIDRVESAHTFHLALSGGNTPKMLFRRLLIDPNFRGLPWTQTHIWQVDERVVADDDAARNFRMINEHLLTQVPARDEHVHPMPVIHDDGDQHYERDLRDAIATTDAHGTPRLDYALLGMGGDGHTASLFPHTPALAEQDRLCVFNDGDSIAVPRPRMTMTYPLINAARTIAILVLGASKHAALQRIALSPDDVQQFPITGITPTHDDTELIWYLDEAAAGGAG